MILVSFTIAVFALMLAPLLPIRDLLTSFNGDLTPAYFYMGAGYLFFVGCYYLNSQITRRRFLPSFGSQQIAKPGLTVKSRYLLFLACWALFGAICSVWQVEATTGVSKYFDLVNQGGSAAEVARASSVMLKSSEGGLPGFIKVWNQNCTGAVLMLTFLFLEGKRIRGFGSYLLVVVIVASFVVRNFVHMDRLALLAILPAIFQLWLRGSALTRRWVVALLAGMAMLAQIQSLRRGHGFGSLEFLMLYLQSGVFNHSVVMETFGGSPTFGAFTIFSQMAWVMQGLGHPLPLYFHFSYVWDDAQDLFGYLFIDFGWYGILVCGIFGLFAQFLDSPSRPKQPQTNKWTEQARTRLQPFVAYLALSSMFVPAFVGPEYWLTALTIVAFTWFESKHGRSLFEAGRSRTRQPGRAVRTFEPFPAQSRLAESVKR